MNSGNRDGRLIEGIRRFHQRLVFPSRTRALAATLGNLIPESSSVLDIGCGDGVISSLIRRKHPTVSITGIEVCARPNCLIECASFDGEHIPCKDKSVDVSMFVDVLHHAGRVETLLKEARRVARRHVLIKDHLCASQFDRRILQFMDWVGNGPYGVNLKCVYAPKQEWMRSLEACGLEIVSWRERIPLYPFPFNFVFGRNLHFVALLEARDHSLP